MATSGDGASLDRRAFLRHLAKGAAALSGAALASRAVAQDSALQDLIEQTQKGGFGQGFDAASRTIQMPKSSLPTLSPATAQTTEQAVAQYEAIVARGGWPAVPAKDRLRIGARHAGWCRCASASSPPAISRPMPA